MCFRKKRRRVRSGINLQMKQALCFQNDILPLNVRFFRKLRSMPTASGGFQVIRPTPTRITQKRVKRENADTTESPNGKEGSTHVAWVAAIIINIFLIVIIIVFVSYCYCRYRKDKKRRQANAVKEWSERTNGRRTSSPYSHWETSSKEGSSLFTIEGSSNHSQNRRKKKRRWKKEGKVYDQEDLRVRPYWNSRRLKRGSSRGVLVRTNFGSYPVAGDDDEDRMRESSGYFSNDNTNNIRYFNNRTPLIGTGYDVREKTMKGGSPRKFLVYQSKILSGKPRNVGHVLLPKDVPLTLHQLRGFLREAETPVREVANRRFHFLTENLRIIRDDERDTVVDHVYPSKAIIIRSEVQDPRISSSVSKPKLEPVYRLPENNVRSGRKYKTAPGGLGVCHAPWCEKKALIKCTECNVAVYCSTRCMKEDKSEHKKVCYKPPWRL